jgi:GT2 family glycosyltransferase
VSPEAFAVRADAWRRIGGMDESLGDLALDEFCARVIANGGCILYDPNFSILLSNSEFYK